MHCHANARPTPRGRAEIFAAVEAGMTVSAACLAFRMSRRTYYRWAAALASRGATSALRSPTASPHRARRG